MEIGDLKRLVREGEHATLEFKRKANHPDKIAREVVAFANSRGGILLIGVDDDHTIYGSKYPLEDAYAIRDHVYKYCVPKIRHSIERVPLNAKREVLVFHIKESRIKPHFLKDPESGKKTAFVRVADMSVTASNEMVYVMRFSRRRKGAEIRYGEHERKILQLLDGQSRTTLAEAQEKLKTNKRNTSITLVNLVRAGLLNIHPTAGEDYFTLSEKAFRD